MRSNTFADEMAGRAAARVDVLPGHAGAIQAVDGIAWKVRMRIIEANLAAITDQPKLRIPAAARAESQENQTGEEIGTAECHCGNWGMTSLRRKWGRRNYYHFEKCGNGGSLSKWKLAPTSCFAILARHDASLVGKGREQCTSGNRR